MRERTPFLFVIEALCTETLLAQRQPGSVCGWVCVSAVNIFKMWYVKMVGEPQTHLSLGTRVQRCAFHFTSLQNALGSRQYPKFGVVPSLGAQAAALQSLTGELNQHTAPLGLSEAIRRAKMKEASESLCGEAREEKWCYFSLHPFMLRIRLMELYNLLHPCCGLPAGVREKPKSCHPENKKSLFFCGEF